MLRRQRDSDVKFKAAAAAAALSLLPNEPRALKYPLPRYSRLFVCHSCGCAYANACACDHNHASRRRQEPRHYYALFSHSIGLDYVLSLYDGGRYELECKYTQFVAVHSRPVWPRFDLTPLAK